MRNHEEQFKNFTSNVPVGVPTNNFFIELLADYDATIKRWQDVEALYDIFLPRAEKFEKTTIQQTQTLNEALAEQGRNLVAEYAHFTEEYNNQSVEYAALGEIVEKIKVTAKTLTYAHIDPLF